MAEMVDHAGSGDPGHSWPAIHASRPWGTWPNEHFIRFVREHYPAPPASFLELGSGGGAQLRLLTEEGFACVGVEISPDAVKRSNNLTFPHSPAKLGDVTAISFLPASFDAVIDIACLQCLPLDVASHIVSNAAGWLKPDGRMFALMASDTVPSGPHSANGTRLASAADIHILFGEHFDFRVGHELTTRPNGDALSHWITDARKK